MNHGHEQCERLRGMKVRILAVHGAIRPSTTRSTNRSSTTSSRMCTVSSVAVNTFLCPSDGTQVNRGMSNYAGHDFGDCSYGNNIGTSLSFFGGVIDGPAYVMGSLSVSGIGTIGTATVAGHTGVDHRRDVEHRHATASGKRARAQPVTASGRSTS